MLPLPDTMSDDDPVPAGGGTLPPVVAALVVSVPPVLAALIASAICFATTKLVMLVGCGTVMIEPLVPGIVTKPDILFSACANQPALIVWPPDQPNYGRL